MDRTAGRAAALKASSDGDAVTTPGSKFHALMVLGRNDIPKALTLAGS